MAEEEKQEGIRVDGVFPNVRMPCHYMSTKEAAVKTEKESNSIPLLTLLKQQFSRHLRSIAAIGAKEQEQEYFAKAIGTLIVLWSARQAPGLPCPDFG